MTSKGNKGLVVLLTVIIVFGFAFLFLSPKYGPQAEFPFLNRGQNTDQDTEQTDVSEVDQIAQEELQKRSNAIDAAINDLSTSQNVSSEDVQVVSVTAQEFGDTSLGCSVEGESYSQVVTPGFSITLKSAETTYDYRVSSDLAIIKVCN